MSETKIAKNMLDSRGNKIFEWSINENRGNMEYDPPIGWIGFGINCWDKYDNGDNTWIGNKNDPNEWCIAYHGVGAEADSKSVKSIIGNIIRDNFKLGSRQAHYHCPDKFYPGKSVGKGVYFSPHIKVAEIFAGISIINGISYKTVLMVRIKPSVIRSCKCPNYYNCNDWVVNGTKDEVRPYRILYKKMDY